MTSPLAVHSELSQSDLNQLVVKAIDWCYCNGLLIRKPKIPGYATNVPFILLPSPFPKYLFEEAKLIQKDVSLLQFKLSQDKHFMEETLDRVLKVDPFTHHLWEILNTVENEQCSQPIDLTILRTDYMIDVINHADNIPFYEHIFKSDLGIRQIEVNTIAVSFTGLSSKMTELHRYLTKQVSPDKRVNLSRIPDNDCLDVVASAFIKAIDIYGKKYISKSNLPLAILFVCRVDESNIFDQRLIEHKIFSYLDPSTKIPFKIIRKTFREIEKCALISSSKHLFIDDMEVGIIYYRAGYSPDDYASEKDWETRLMLEKSMAIKCPSIRWHLSGVKKIQQRLTNSGVLENYCSKETEGEKVIERIRKTYVDIYSLDQNEDGDKAIDMANKNPELFVLKPQREGGGNNFYGSDIPVILRRICHTKERDAFILMRRIRPPPFSAYSIGSSFMNNQQQLLTTDETGICNNFSLQQTEHISELGIYGVMITNNQTDEVILNECGGHLLRSKLATTDEGGVSTGFSSIDSPLLV